MCPPQQLLLVGWREAQAVGPHLILGVTPLSGRGLWRWVGRLHVVGVGPYDWGCPDRCPGNGEHLHPHPRLPLPDGLPCPTTSQAPPMATAGELVGAPQAGPVSPGLQTHEVNAHAKRKWRPLGQHWAVARTVPTELVLLLQMRKRQT